MTEHPDPEALSAYFDGEASEWDAHVRACPECRSQLERLERVRAAVGAPVPPVDPAQKDAAIDAALSGGASSSGPRLSRWAAIGGVAAVALGVLVGIVATRDTTSKHQFASRDTSSGPVSPTAVDGGDLGVVDDATALRAKVEPGVASSAAAPSAEAAPSASSSPAAAAAPAGARKQAATAGVVPCEREARALQPGTEVLVYRATAAWQGTPAVVLGFSPADAPATTAPGRRVPTRVYVLARSDCRLLSFQSYAP